MKDSYEFWVEQIVEECNKVLSSVDKNVVESYIDCICGAKRVFFIGVGRVLLSLEAIAKRYNHIGIDCAVVGQITEPAITPQDVLLVGSGSGNSLVPRAISDKAKSLGAKLVHIGSDPNGYIAQKADLFVRLPAHTKSELSDEIPTKQPMTSQFEQALLFFGDVTAAMIIARKNIDLDSLWKYHANLE